MVKQSITNTSQNGNNSPSNAAIASRLIAELKDEQRWIKQFESTTDEQWDRLADMVRREISDGDTVLLLN